MRGVAGAGMDPRRLACSPTSSPGRPTIPPIASASSCHGRGKLAMKPRQARPPPSPRSRGRRRLPLREPHRPERVSDANVCRAAGGAFFERAAGSAGHAVSVVCRADDREGERRSRPGAGLAALVSAVRRPHPDGADLTRCSASGHAAVVARLCGLAGLATRRGGRGGTPWAARRCRFEEFARRKGALHVVSANATEAGLDPAFRPSSSPPNHLGLVVD